MELNGEGLETTWFTGLRARQHPVIQRYCGDGGYAVSCACWMSDRGLVGLPVDKLYGFELASVAFTSCRCVCREEESICHEMLLAWSPIILRSLDR